MPQSNHKKSKRFLDVWETEPVVNLDLMQDCEFISPHIAGYSYDGKVNGTQMIYEAACKHLEVKPQWQPDLPAAEPDHIDYNCENKSAEEAMLEVTKRLYSISNDDARMRDALKCFQRSRS